MEQQTSIYLRWATKSALIEMAAEKQSEIRRKVSPNDMIVEMIWNKRPDLALKHGLEKPKVSSEDPDTTPHPKKTAELYLEPAV